MNNEKLEKVIKKCLDIFNRNFNIDIYDYVLEGHRRVTVTYYVNGKLKGYSFNINLMEEDCNELYETMLNMSYYIANDILKENFK